MIEQLGIVCTLLAPAEAKLAGLPTSTLGRKETGNKCLLGSRNDPEEWGQLDAGYFTRDQFDTLIQRSEAIQNGTIRRQLTLADTYIVVITTQKPVACVAVAQRSDGGVVDLVIAQSSNQDQACNDAERLATAAMSRLPKI